MIETINEEELEQLNKEVEEGSRSESSEEDSEGKRVAMTNCQRLRWIVEDLVS